MSLCYVSFYGYGWTHMHYLFKGGVDDVRSSIDSYGRQRQLKGYVCEKWVHCISCLSTSRYGHSDDWIHSGMCICDRLLNHNTHLWLKEQTHNPVKQFFKILNESSKSSRETLWVLLNLFVDQIFYPGTELLIINIIICKWSFVGDKAKWI